jgi:hypothetical protein
MRGLASLVAVLASLAPAAAIAQSDPLPSWNDGASKSAIVEFVTAVTTAGTDFVPPSERIAVFDNDGTLWTEQPVYSQLLFAFDRIRELAPLNPEWADTEPYKSVIAGDMESLLATGEKGLLEIMAATHAGMSVDAFHAIVDAWIASAIHPKVNRPFTEAVYQPMLELIAYLDSNGFKSFIVSGGGIEFMRPWAEAVYGIPPERVVGSSGVVAFSLDLNGVPVLTKKGEVEFVDDGPGKPVGINRFIGHRPIAAFGNSDGDLEMLQYTAAGDGRRLAAYIHHDDGVREVAYDRGSRIGVLDKGLSEAAAKGWLVVSMKDDWRTIFPEE